MTIKADNFSGKLLDFYTRIYENQTKKFLKKYLKYVK